MLWLNRPCSYYDCKMQLRNNHQETLEKKKKGLLLIGPGNYVADLGPHSEVWIKRESAGARSSFIGVKGGSLRCYRLILYW